MSTQPRGILVTDFDGTMTRNDFYKMVIAKLLPPGCLDYWAQYPSGEITPIAEDLFSKAEWIETVRIAPSIKEGYYTVFSSRDELPEVRRLLGEDSCLQACFR